MKLQAVLGIASTKTPARYLCLLELAAMPTCVFALAMMSQPVTGATAFAQALPPPTVAGRLDHRLRPAPPVYGAHDVYAVALQPDGRILIGGCFTSVDGQRRIGIESPDVGITLAWATNPLTGRYYYHGQPSEYGSFIAKCDAMESSIRLGTSWLGSSSVSSAFVARLADVEPPRFAVLPPSLCVSNGEIRLRLIGCGGRGSVAIEASTDLAHWTPVVTNAVPAEPFECAVPISAECATRFFRARNMESP